LAEFGPEIMRVTNKDYGQCLAMVECAACGLVQSALALAPAEIVQLYAAMDDDAYLESAAMRGESNYQQVKRALKGLDSATRVLEIGAGSGALVDLLSKDFAQIEGVEPSDAFCAYAKEKHGLELRCCGVEDLDGSGEYDAVLALDVIEHVASPADFMATVRRLLKPGGRVVIVTPNLGSITAKLLGQKWWHIRPPHVYYFSTASFRRLAEQHDLQVESVRNFSWKLPLGYLLDSIQRLLFKKTLVDTSGLKWRVTVDTLDSKMFVLRKA
jgi:SAM-dependent methyltransferase